MVKRITLPPGALDDICTLIRLSADQLKALDELFSTGESASPMREVFINKVAEALRVDIADARTVVAVCHYLLLYPRPKGDETFVGDLLDDFRDFIEVSVSEGDLKDVLANFDNNRHILESLATPKHALLRAKKIRRLQSRPEQHIDSIRTICQLRPLFEGPEDDEQIAGLIPVILLEIKSTGDDGDLRTLVFGMADEELAELERVVKRTREKLKAIGERYKSELLTVD